MSNPLFRAPRRTSRVFAGLLAASACLSSGAQDAKRKAEAQQQLQAVHGKVQALSKEQAQTAAERNALNAKLAEQATALSVAARAVRETDAQLAAKQRDLAQLQEQRETLRGTLDKQKQAIAELLRATYALGQGSDLRVLLGDDDVARIARALAYSKYFQQDRVQRVQQLMTDLEKLQQLETAINAEQQSLQAQRAQRQQQQATLQQKRAEQQKLIAQVDATYKDQGQKLAALKQDEASLNSLVAQLQKAIDQAAREAAARAKREHPNVPQIPPEKAAGDIRGNLPWPAQGAVRSYGNGVLIAAERGSDVHAVARGQVIYAGFLRGYGMLVILDHGGGWMSMYGNNETMLHKVGETLGAGEALGSAAPVTGINTGVYFELRHNGKSVDPRAWLSQHR